MSNEVPIGSRWRWHRQDLQPKAFTVTGRTAGDLGCVDIRYDDGAVDYQPAVWVSANATRLPDEPAVEVPKVPEVGKWYRAPTFNTQLWRVVNYVPGRACQVGLVTEWSSGETPSQITLAYFNANFTGPVPGPDEVKLTRTWVSNDGITWVACDEGPEKAMWYKHVKVCVDPCGPDGASVKADNADVVTLPPADVAAIVRHTIQHPPAPPRCSPGCTPAAPCGEDVCPAYREETKFNGHDWSSPGLTRDLRNEAQGRPFTEPLNPYTYGPPTPMLTGSASLACPWYRSKR